MDLILGAVWRLEFNDLVPFFTSLRRTSFEGAIAFFVVDVGEVTCAALEELGVHIIRAPEDSPIINMQVNSLRYFVYEGFLDTLPDTFENIMLTDVRDLVFQNDPFDFARARPMACFLEDRSKTLLSCEYNSEWLAVAYGVEVVKELGHHSISCSGTTIGTVDAIKRYVKIMAEELGALCERLPGITEALVPVDQGVHNFVVNTRLAEEVEFFANETGPILTLHHVPPEAVRFDDEGQFINTEGDVVNVVHQYDRHPELLKRVHARFGGGEG